MTVSLGYTESKILSMVLDCIMYIFRKLPWEKKYRRDYDVGKIFLTS
jgi:vesicle coat complex subunit